jgi:hypothetical protein
MSASTSDRLISSDGYSRSQKRTAVHKRSAHKTPRRKSQKFFSFSAFQGCNRATSGMEQHNEERGSFLFWGLGKGGKGNIPVCRAFDFSGFSLFFFELLFPLYTPFLNNSHSRRNTMTSAT